MRRLCSLLALLVVAGPAAPVAAQVYPERIAAITRVRETVKRVERYQRPSQRETQTERFTKTVNIGANGELVLTNIAGDIVITRGGGDSATIEVIKTARGETVDDARAALPFVQVDIVERANRAEVRTRYPDSDELRRRGRRNLSVSVAFNVSAPAGTRVIVKSISGSISVKDIQGELSLESVSGAVSIANSARIAHVRTISGDVDLADARIEGVLDASSVSGLVQIRRVTAESIELGSISGNVIVEDVHCGRVKIQSISGRAQFTGELAPNGRYELTSHSGEVRLVIAGSTGFTVEASSFSGSVRSDVPITLEGGRPSRGRQRGMRGRYGDGSAVLDLTTFSGSIVITKR
jgi:DUF4097 and DUF4098 domain-containing protein YvlB